ncbi:MAG: aldehyde dehydrogenase family protein, partial [Fimbriimonadaceae bacterium]|nr:aldehyde dehydrogenase family protein [Fimbriimonadaceae bacterium]
MDHGLLLIDGRMFGGPCDQGIGKGVSVNPWSGSVAGTWAEAGPEEVEAAVAAAWRAFPAWRSTPSAERSSLLRRIAALGRERRDLLADLMVREIGKPISAARAELDRAWITLELAAKRCGGPEAIREVDPGPDPRGDQWRITARREPLGPVFAITPYNWPFNLCAHKLAAGLAAGCTLVVKGSEKSGLCHLEFGRLIHEAGCPPGVVNFIQAMPRDAEAGLADPRIRGVSFTGSDRVGWMLKGRHPQKKWLLELGGNAFGFVMPGADPARVAREAAQSAFLYAGQICISLQTLLVHSAVYDEVRERLAEEAASFPSGDPSREEVLCGPVIDREAADRIEALLQGERVLVGGERNHGFIRPALVELSDPGSRLATEEAFGPVLALSRIESLQEGISRVNQGRYGLQAAIWTDRADEADRAFDELEVGGLIVNGPPTTRFDAMPD